MIVRRLLMSARESRPERRRVSLNQVVSRTMDLQKIRLASEKVNVELDLDEALPFVLGDAGQLQQVLMNLIGNARQAIEQRGNGGTIRLSTKCIDSGRHAQLEVSDDGPGILPEIASRIFDPFFTTKPAGIGTGLGLAIVHGVVREHGGRVKMAVAADSREHPAHGAQLESAVSALAAYAPVVVIGHARHQSDLAQLVTDGLADFVARSNGYLPVALGLVQHRLHHVPKLLSVALPPASLEDATADAFGEVLRHELNNPLTGILGNAELLLAEVRRKNDGQLPNGGQQRLETIAALAVRLRETVHRLSQDWESRNRTPQSSAQPRTAH